MPDLLLELFSEEIPARMQGQAAEDLRRLVTNMLVDAGLTYEGAKAFATPRRLALTVQGLPAQQPDTREERKGPRVGAPEGAINGFLKAAGLASIDEAKIQQDPKGDFYLAVLEKKGRTTIALLSEKLPEIIRAFPWPKSMRWGNGSMRWVRPLHSILCTFGSAMEETEIVPFEVEGIVSGDTTYGHRFLSPQSIRIRRFDDYQPALEKAFVVLDAARRRDIILHDAKDLSFAQGLELVEDAGLLEEVAGLVEWPVVKMGAFDAAFLDVPEEVIRTTIRANQKCFVLRDGNGKLTNKFILVSNIAAKDGGAAIVAGNERVVRARLADARFFWEGDKKIPLADRAAKLQNVVFHAKLGTQADRVKRIEELAVYIAKQIGADENEVRTAAQLCKADLLTETVGEFPEVQGLAGRYLAPLAINGNLSPNIAEALSDHYKPQGPSDTVPSNKVTIAVALADKIDTLTGFWAIDEKPTGSKDPYALRRAALGVIRLLLENGLRCSLTAIIEYSTWWYAETLFDNGMAYTVKYSTDFQYDGAGEPFQFETENYVSCIMDFESDDRNFDDRYDYIQDIIDSGCYIKSYNDTDIKLNANGEPVSEFLKLELFKPTLIAFLADRLKVQLREQGARHDLVDAVFALPNQDDLFIMTRRIEALGTFLNTDDGKNLLAGYRRAANIVKAEEKKDGQGAFDAAPDASILQEDAEKVLHHALQTAITTVEKAVSNEDFTTAMQALSTLRAPVDAFFDKITVNANEPNLRQNRLRLLTQLRDAVHKVADFSKIAG